MNLYTGGSLMMRARGATIRWPPSSCPACAPAAAASTSTAARSPSSTSSSSSPLLQNIGANAVGYAFKLALQSISPDIDKLLTELQDQINKINAMNINSARPRRRW